MELKFFAPSALSDAYRVKLVSAKTSILLASVGSTVTRFQTETEVYYTMKNKTFFFCANPTDFYVV